MNYQKWAGGEPNDWGSGEDCGGYYSGHTHGLWNDQPCDWKIPYVCGYRVREGGLVGTPVELGREVSVAAVASGYPVSASSEWDANWSPHRARLDYPTPRVGG